MGHKLVARWFKVQRSLTFIAYMSLIAILSKAKDNRSASLMKTVSSPQVAGINKLSIATLSGYEDVLCPY